RIKRAGGTRPSACRARNRRSAVRAPSGGVLSPHTAHKPHGHVHRRSVALFGGTFDPIHSGHIAVAQAAQKRFHLDAIYFIPSSRPPHKAKRALTPFLHRYA